MIRTNIYLTQKQLDFLKTIKREQGTNASESIRQLINNKMGVGHGREEEGETEDRPNTRAS